MTESMEYLFRCMIFYHAHLLAQLLYYQSEITQLAFLYSFRQWYTYDRAFRTRVANKAIDRWDYFDTELRANYLVSSMSQQPNSYTCWLCGKTGHVSTQCPNKNRHHQAAQPYRPHASPNFTPRPMLPFPAPQREFAAPQRSATIHNPGTRTNRLCMYWNQERGCNNSQCTFRHECSKCHQTDHSQQHCRHR